MSDKATKRWLQEGEEDAKLVYLITRGALGKDEKPEIAWFMHGGSFGDEGGSVS